MSGTKRNHNRLEVGYFAQHQLDELEASQTPYEYFRELLPNATEAQRRAKLGSYGFGAALADTKATNLSGGEKARMLFALATFKGPHILVLDEPTNHLDVDARQALVMALNDFQGAVILISHDRHLIEASADRLWLVNEGTVSPYDGDLNDYTELVLNQARQARRKASGKASKPATARPRRAASSNGAPKPTYDQKPLRKKIQVSEANMQKIQEKITILDTALADTSLYTQEPEKAQNFARLRAKLGDQLAAAESDWLEACDALESSRNARAC